MPAVPFHNAYNAHTGKQEHALPQTPVDAHAHAPPVGDTAGATGQSSRGVAASAADDTANDSETWPALSAGGPRQAWQSQT